MEELMELRKKLEARDLEGALAIVNELDEMSREDKINKIFSFSVILLQHIIKKEVEKRTTNSWEASIKEAMVQIKRINRKRTTGGTYLHGEELGENLEEAFPVALAKATAEAFGGALTEQELAAKFDRQILIDKVLKLIN